MTRGGGLRIINVAITFQAPYRPLSTRSDNLHNDTFCGPKMPILLMDFICIGNRIRPSRIKDKFSRLVSKFSQNSLSRAETRAICENFENTSENLSVILLGLLNRPSEETILHTSSLLNCCSAYKTKQQ